MAWIVESHPRDVESHLSTECSNRLASLRDNGLKVLRLPTVLLAALLLLASSQNPILFGSPVHASTLPSEYVGDAAEWQIVAAASSPAPSPLLRVIEVDPPVRFNQAGDNAYSDPNSPSVCQQTLVTHSFAFSYGIPYIGSYAPPTCKFNRVVWNLTVVSAGRQFDRLGTVSLGDIEIFRTSTAEPTKNGIIWTYLKDVSSFLTLFKEQQTVIFDLGNLIDNTYTAAYNVTLTASYYQVNGESDAADLILPLSRGLDNATSAFTFPSQNVSSSFSIPQNSVKAIFTIAATGQSNEEFWWSNVLQQDVNDFPSDGVIPGYSPFREVQLLIDGNLAGVVWPFPVIFTGGVVPGFWRPIVGIDAFDLKEDDIDITPWLPLLCDGKQHQYSIKVSGLVLSPDGTTVLSETVDDYWIVTGKLFIWLDPSSHKTTGSHPELNFPTPNIAATSQFQNSSQPNDSVLNYQVNVGRQLSVFSNIRTSAGEQRVSWQQSLTYSGVGQYSQGGNYQYNALQISGQDDSSSGYARTISYPLNSTSLYTTYGNISSITATINRGKEIKIFGCPVFPTGLESFASTIDSWLKPGSLLSTTQEGQASYIANSTSSTSFSFGETIQELAFSAVYPEGGYGQNSDTTELYHRNVVAANGTIVQDQVTDEGQDVQPTDASAPAATAGVLHGYALVTRPGTSGSTNLRK